MGHMSSDLTRAPEGQHEILLSPSFKDLFCIWVCLNVSYLLYLHCISRGYTHSGLFLTNFIVLWFSTLTIILVKLVIFFILVKIVCKACYNLYINAQICYFCCILGPLWPVTSEATVAPLPLYSSNMGLRSACAHEEVYTLLNASFDIHK